MKVVLPSLGALGIKTVDLREPKIKDLREIANSNKIDSLIRLDLVKLLIDEKVSLDKITKYDSDYLFTIAALSIQFNSLAYQLQCPHCKRQIHTELNLEDKELITLEDRKFPIKVVVNGVERTYRLLSAQDEIDIVDYALSTDGDYQTLYENMTVSKILSEPIENINELHSGTYLSALLFNQAMYHGIPTQNKIQCPNCNKTVNVLMEPTSKMLPLSTTDLISHFASVHDVLSFESFLDLTIPEFSTLIKSLNSRANAR